MIYEASPLKPKRQRATKADMQIWDEFLYGYASEHNPVTIRQLFYAATVHLNNIPKTEKGYGKIQRRVKQLRLNGQLPFEWIADYSRTVWAVDTDTSPDNALERVSRNYRYDYWSARRDGVEVWIEKSALAGVLFPITQKYRVELFPTAGEPSITYLETAVRGAVNKGFESMTVYTMYDFDASGVSAAKTVSSYLHRFGQDQGLEIIHRPLALDYEMVMDLQLPARPPKKEKKKWDYSIAAELDAIPPSTLRQLVDDTLAQHMPPHQLMMNRQIEMQHKSQIRMALSEF